MPYKSHRPLGSAFNVKSLDALAREQQIVNDLNLEESARRAAVATGSRRRPMLLATLAVVVLVASSWIIYTLVGPTGIVRAPVDAPAMVARLAALGPADARITQRGTTWDVTFGVARAEAATAVITAWANSQGYRVDTAPGARDTLMVTGPQGGLLMVYLPAGNDTPTVRLSVDTTSLTGDGASLR